MHIVQSSIMIAVSMMDRNESDKSENDEHSHLKANQVIVLNMGIKSTFSQAWDALLRCIMWRS